MTERNWDKSLQNCSSGLFLPQHAGSNANFRDRLRVLFRVLVLLFRVFIFEGLDFIGTMQCTLYITQTFKIKIRLDCDCVPEFYMNETGQKEQHQLVRHFSNIHRV
jgi:hypothetical protein